MNCNIFLKTEKNFEKTVDKIKNDYYNNKRTKF